MADAFAAPSPRTFSTEEQFGSFAAAFARRLRPGDVVAISGPLGAGKTAFVRAIVCELHHADETSSPTFTFWHTYPGRPPIEHIDLFRLDDPRECAELGLEEAFNADSIALVEWWEKAPDLLPKRRYEVRIDGVGDGPRTVALADPV